MPKNESLLSQVKFEVNELDYNKLRANETHIPKGKFIINGQLMNSEFINSLYTNNFSDQKKEHQELVNKLYNQGLYDNDLYNKKGDPPLSVEDLKAEIFKTEIFKNMLKRMKLPVPNDYIIQELITSCDKYESFVSTNVLLGSNLIVEGGHNKEININFINPKCVELKINTEGKYFIQGQSHDSDLLSLSSSLEFKLKSNYGPEELKPKSNKEEIKYTDGKLSLTVTPNSLGAKENQSLFSKVIAAIQELLEKIFGKEHVKMKEYKLEFNEPKSAINNPKADSIDKQEKSAS